MMYGQFGHENLQNMSFINKCIKSPKISSIDPPWYPDFKKHKIVQFGSLFGEKMAMVVTRGATRANWRFLKVFALFHQS